MPAAAAPAAGAVLAIAPASVQLQGMMMAAAMLEAPQLPEHPPVDDPDIDQYMAPAAENMFEDAEVAMGRDDELKVRRRRIYF